MINFIKGIVLFVYCSFMSFVCYIILRLLGFDFYGFFNFFIIIIFICFCILIVFKYIFYIKNKIKNKKIQEECKIKNKKQLKDNIYLYISNNMNEIVQKFFDTNGDNFSNFLYELIKNKYDSNVYFDDVFTNKLDKIHLLFNNKKFNIIKKINIKNIKPLSNIKIIDKDNIKYDNIVKINNNCLIRPLYFSKVYTYNEFENKHYLFLLYKKIIVNIFNYIEKIPDESEKNKEVLLVIQEEVNSFSNYLKTFIKVIEEEKIREENYFFRPYSNLFIETCYSYTIENVPFDDKNLSDINKINKNKQYITEKNIIDNYNSTIKLIEQKKNKIKNIIYNYNIGLEVDNYYSLIMKYFFLPYWAMEEYDATVYYEKQSNLLFVEIKIPSESNAPRIVGIKNILKTTGEIKYKYYTDSQFKKTYNSFIYQYILAVIYFIFKFDYNSYIKAICVNGIKTSINTSTGITEEKCILSIHTTRETFEKINLYNVDAKSCFKYLKGISGIDFINITPIIPIIQFDKKDKRIVNGYDVVDQLTPETNLASMDWKNFENLIRDIFEKEFSNNGSEVKVTRASRDGGVDAIIFDPDPIKGGKIVIQAKRYTNIVGISAVRDLYGTVHNEGATKGILVTTSNFGPDAYEFAKNKPLTLLSGNNLLYLLEKHGYKAKIDITEAKINFYDEKNHNK